MSNFYPPSPSNPGNPFGPPSPDRPATYQPWSSPYPTTYPNTYPTTYPTTYPATPTAKVSAAGVLSLAMSGAALVCVVVLALFFAASAAPDFAPGGGDSGSGWVGGEYEPLTGKLSSPPSGSISDATLSAEVTRVITDDGGDVSAMRCPTSSAVRAGTFAMCHGTISGEDWAVAVFFESAVGDFTLDLM